MVQQGAVEAIQRNGQRLTPHAQKSERGGGHQQDGGQDGQNALNDHMNSFSPWRAEYKPATKSPYPL